MVGTFKDQWSWNLITNKKIKHFQKIEKPAIFTKIDFAEKVVELQYVSLPAICFTTFSFFNHNKINIISWLDYENFCVLWFLG